MTDAAGAETEAEGEASPSGELLELTIQDPDWGAAATLAAGAAAAVRAALEAAEVASDQVSISLLLTSDAEMRALNARFRDRDAATNVLSWPAMGRVRPLTNAEIARLRSEERRVFLGDVALGREIVTQEALEAGEILEQRLAHLIVHGVLHLLGYDHEADDAAAQMMARETAALASLGWPDPYRGDDAAVAAMEKR